MSSSSFNLLIISPLIPATGNLFTVGRLQSHFQKHNIDTTICSSTQLELRQEACSVAKVNQIASEAKSSGILLLHAYKSGLYMLCSCGKNCKLRLRYGIVFGGTDLNEDVKDRERRWSIAKCIEGASFSVAFTKHLKEIATSLCPTDLVFVKGQALDYELYSALHTEDDIFKPRHVTQSRKMYIFVLPCNIRPVKDPLFVVQDFFKWASSIHHAFDVRLLILGNKTDQSFSSEFFMHLDKLQNRKKSLVLTKVDEALSSLGRKQPPTTCNAAPNSDYDLADWISDSNGRLVMHLPSLPRQNFQQCLQTGLFFAVINSSRSEGMASSILEAMAIGVPVLARDIPSNKVLIKDRDTGLLFNTGEEFVNQADRLVKSEALQQQLSYNARKHVMQHHVPHEEAEFYVSLARSTFL